MIDLPDPLFLTQKLSVYPGGPWSATKLFLNGALVEGNRGAYVVKNDAGAEVRVTVKSGFPDSLPRVTIAGVPQVLAKPFRWYEYAWICLPFLLLIMGGALGGGVGVLAIMINGWIFRGEHGALAKYAMSACVTVAACVVVVILAALVALLIHP